MGKNDRTQNVPETSSKPTSKVSNQSRHSKGPEYGLDLLDNQRNPLLTPIERTYSAHRQSLPKKLKFNSAYEKSSANGDQVEGFLNRAAQKKNRKALQFRLNVAKGFEQSIEPFNGVGGNGVGSSLPTSPKFMTERMARRPSALFVKQGCQFGSLPPSKFGNLVVKIFDGNMKQAYCEESQQTESTQTSPSRPYLGSEISTPRRASKFLNIDKHDSSSSLKPLDLSPRNSSRTVSSSKSESRFQDSPRSYLDSFISKAQMNVETCFSNQTDLRVTVRRNLFKETLQKPTIQSSLPSLAKQARSCNYPNNQNHLTRNLKTSRSPGNRLPSKFQQLQCTQKNTGKDIKLVVASTPSSPLRKEKKQPIKAMPTLTPTTRSRQQSPNEGTTLSVQGLVDLTRKKEERIKDLLMNFNEEEIQTKDKEVALSIRKAKLQRMRTIDLRQEKPRHKEIPKLPGLELMVPPSPRLRALSSFRHSASHKI